MNTLTTEKLSKQRRNLIFVNGTAFAVWELTSLEMLRSAIDAVLVWSIISLAGAAVWTATLFFLMRFSSDGKLPKASIKALNDELAQQNRLRAYQIGFFFAIFTAGLIYMVAGKIDFIVRDVLLIILVAGVTSATYRFAMLEGESE